MAKIQAHSTAKQINQIQDKPYVITQKQVQQQHFQKLKVRRQRHDKGKVPQSQNHFVRRIIALDLRLFSFSPVVESSERDEWLTLVSSLAY